MSRTTVDIDEELLAEAKEATGRNSIKGVVEFALLEVVRKKRLERLAGLKGSGIIRLTPEELEEMRRGD
ncbi:MAG: type II toxin-antitoxin system VapB family antitoxin [Actinomycetota bacterium]